MGPRGTIERLLALQSGDELDQEQIQRPVNDMAMVLLTDLCSELSFALAGARGCSAHRRDAHKQAIEQVAAIRTVLAVWEMEGLEVIDGPGMADTLIEPPWRN